MLISVHHASHVFQARQMAVSFARELGFTEEQAGKVAIIANELSTNLIRHATAGEFSASKIEESGIGGVELLSIDKGPGMADVQQSLADGYSTKGTAGTGLGAVRRLSDRFGIFSQPGKGTAVLARLLRRRPPEAAMALEVGGVVAPFPGEEVSGDAWAYLPRADGGTLLVADGLGHGPDAAAAAQAALRVARKMAGLSGTRLAEAIHNALASTRGAAIGIADIDPPRGQVTYVGIGNISGALIESGTSRAMVSHNGTAGLTARRIAEFVYPFSGPATVVLHSDGVSARWNIGDYPGLDRQHASIVAAVLYRDFKRGRDDATVAVGRVIA